MKKVQTTENNPTESRNKVVIDIERANADVSQCNMTQQCVDHITLNEPGKVEGLISIRALTRVFAS